MDTVQTQVVKPNVKVRGPPAPSQGSRNRVNDQLSDGRCSGAPRQHPRSGCDARGDGVFCAEIPATLINQ